MKLWEIVDDVFALLQLKIELHLFRPNILQETFLWESEWQQYQKEKESLCMENTRKCYEANNKIFGTLIDLTYPSSSIIWIRK